MTDFYTPTILLKAIPKDKIMDIGTHISLYGLLDIKTFTKLMLDLLKTTSVGRNTSE
jgi:hypothetical protein